MNAEEPPFSVLIKLGSIIRHFEEGTGPDGHEFDLGTAKSLMEDAEVREWLGAMDKLALLPVKRSS